MAKFGIRTPVREAAYDAIDSERVYQDRGLGNAKGAGIKSLGDHILCIRKLLNDTELAWYKPGGLEDALDHVRKMAAVAVRAMEVHGVQFRDLP